MARFGEAISEAKVAQESDPISIGITANVGLVLYWVRMHLVPDLSFLVFATGRLFSLQTRAFAALLKIPLHARHEALPHGRATDRADPS